MLLSAQSWTDYPYTLPAFFTFSPSDISTTTNSPTASARETVPAPCFRPFLSATPLSARPPELPFSVPPGPYIVLESETSLFFSQFHRIRQPRLGLMSKGSGAVPTPNEMGFQETKEVGENSGVVEIKSAERVHGDEDNDTDDGAGVEEDEDGSKLPLGPRFSLKQHLEKDKDDESLRRWKEQLLGSVDFDNIGESFEPEMKILSLAIVSPDRPDIILPVPENGTPNGLWFTLKEGSHYRLRFTFQVSNNIVSGLRYTNTVWKAGIKVDSTREMLGTFSPQPEPYTHLMHEEITPSGILARGSYSARSKFLDDDDKCYLEINYTFDIQKEWATS